MKTKENVDRVYYKHIFYFAMIAFILLFFVLLFATHGKSARGVLFWDNKDTFMDHFNSVVYSSDDPYASGVIYPPLATVMYRLLSMIVPPDIFDSVITDATAFLQPKEMKIYQGFLFGFVLISIFSAIIFFFAVNELKQGKKSEKMIFVSVIGLSSPVLFMIDRGNSIAISLVLCLFYLAFYRSENKVARELSLLALAVAVGLKLYPLAFGVLLLRERKYKELFRTAIYCILLTVVPFFIFFNGFESIGLLLENISRFGGIKGLDDTTQLSFSKMLIYPFNVLRIRLTDLDAAGTFFKYFVTAACVISTFFVKKRWKVVLLCACIVYGFQDMCVGYMLTFFILPLILFFNEEKEKRWQNYVYIICFVIIFAPIPFMIPATGVWTRYAMEKISSYAVGIMTGLVVIESFSDIFDGLEKKFALKKKYFWIVTIVALLLLFFVEVFVNPCAWFDIGIGTSFGFAAEDTVKTVVSLVLLSGMWFGALYLLKKKTDKTVQKGSI